MMIAPLRSAFAGQLMVCDMKMSSRMSSSKALSVAVDAKMPAQHCVIQAESVSTEIRIESQGTHTANNCCNDDGACKSDCHFALSASLFIQHTDYSPALLNAHIIDNISNALLIRVLNPPSRPPLFLFS